MAFAINLWHIRPMKGEQITYSEKYQHYFLGETALISGDILETRMEDGSWCEAMFEKASDGHTNEPTFLLCLCDDTGQPIFPPVLAPKTTRCRWPKNLRNVMKEAAQE